MVPMGIASGPFGVQGPHLDSLISGRSNTIRSLSKWWLVGVGKTHLGGGLWSVEARIDHELVVPQYVVGRHIGYRVR